MADQHPMPITQQKKFWAPLLSGTITGLVLFILAVYFDFANILICLFFIPFTAGFVTLIRANALIQADLISRIFLPWAALVITLPLAYWKLKIFILLTFPIASLGGWVAGKLMTHWRQSKD